MPSNEREYQKNYIYLYNVFSPLVECECGAILKKCNTYQHVKRSKRHKVYVNDIPDIKNLKNDVEKLKNMICGDQQIK
jgi:hypothetical protein